MSIKSVLTKRKRIRQEFFRYSQNNQTRCLAFYKLIYNMNNRKFKFEIFFFGFGEAVARRKRRRVSANGK